MWLEFGIVETDFHKRWSIGLSSLYLDKYSHSDQMNLKIQCSVNYCALVNLKKKEEENVSIRENTKKDFNKTTMEKFQENYDKLNMGPIL